MTVTLTTREELALASFVLDAAASNGAKTVEELLNDNITNMTPEEIAKELSWPMQSTGGVVASLVRKGFLVWGSKEDRRNGYWPASLTDEGVRRGWVLAFPPAAELVPETPAPEKKTRARKPKADGEKAPRAPRKPKAEKTGA